MDPDEQLARALDIALSPWGANVTHVSVGPEGASAGLSVDRARTIAEATHADVVMWVSQSEGRYSAWIYDVASDQASLRELTSGPPFDATTAAGVALSVKALLRFTVVAPPPERFGATAEEATWTFGLSTSIATHFGTTPQPEPRGGVEVGFWPGSFGHRWGATLGVSSGIGVHVDDSLPTFSGTLTDFAARAAVAARIPFRPWLALEPSIGISEHYFSLEYSVKFIGAPPEAAPKKGTLQHGSAAIEPQVALNIALFRGFIRLSPWVGASLLQRAHRFRVQGVDELEAAEFTVETGVHAELALP